MKSILCIAILLASQPVLYAQQITAAGQPARLDIRQAADNSIRVTLKPISFKESFPFTPALADRAYPTPQISVRTLDKVVKKKVGNLNVELRPDPLTLIVTNSQNQPVQEVTFEQDGKLSFRLNGQPVLGMGEGGPRPERGTPWRTQLVQFPWGWGLSYMGPSEDRVPPLQSELNNHAIEPIAKKYDELRYQLMPYTYTLAWEARNAGMPLQRAMWLHYPTDEKVRNMGDQFMWGRELLVAPVYEKGAASRQVYLPKGEWYDWWTNAKESGGKSITRNVDLSVMPIYVRAGSIIPFDPVRQYTSEVVNEPTTLKVFTGANGEFTLYDDDGISQEYLNGKANWTKMLWNDNTKTLKLEPAAPKGSTNIAVQRTFKVELLPQGTIKTINYSGKPVKINF